MANIDRTFAGAAAEVNLTGPMTPTAPAAGTPFVVAGDVSSWPSVNFVTMIDTEKFLIANRAGTTFTVGAGGRGYDGTTATNHAANAPMIHLLDAQVMTELVDHVNDVGRDDHTQYLPAAGSDGAGLTVAGRVLAVKTDNVGVEIATDAVQLKNQGVLTAKLADLNVTTVKLADDAVTAPKLADASVDTGAVVDKAVTNPKLADVPATTVKGAVAAGAVTDISFAALTAALGPYPRVFATVAARDAAIPTPSDGMMCVTADTNSLWQYVDTLWFRPWTVLHRQTYTTTINGIGVGGFDLPTSPSIALPANRRIGMHAQITVVGGPGGCVMSLKMDGTTQPPALGQFNNVPAGGCIISGEARVFPAAGNHTFTLGTVAVTGTFDLVAASTTAWYEIRDLGPV